MKKPTVFFIGLFLLFAFAISSRAEEITHTVVKGDTLWDISIKYLNTPWKWPLVWANNQDITNPHLIYPGDLVVITKDGEKTIIKIIPSPDRGGTESEMAIYTPEETAAVKEKSIMVAPQYSTYMYSPNILAGSGRVFKKNEGGELISQNDRIVIKTTSELKQGQTITLVSKIQDVMNGKKTAGYLYRITGIAKVEEVQNDIAKALVTYSLQEARVGSVIFDDIAPIKPMMLTLSEPGEVSSSIIDFHGGIQGSSTNDLVFLSGGKNQGIDKGSILNVAVKTDLDDAGSKGASVVFHEYIGIVVVLQALDNTSMALVVESKTLIEKGSVLMGKK
ncbi:MAG TPA: LysM peptidoglycan-binding domain-containing protein [Deltaproteobacteria bacterium]|nr:LysM peptidoglycan-binding domain-containing protein [Deltaproteobacteria bacterium]